MARVKKDLLLLAVKHTTRTLSGYCKFERILADRGRGTESEKNK